MTPRHLLAGAALILMLSGCALVPDLGAPPPSATSASPTASSAPASFVINGSLTVPGSDTYGGCTTSAGYDDIREGAQVEVQDASGTTLALGDLSAPILNQYRCEYSFSVFDVPEGESIYAVKIGNDARGSQKYSRDQLRSRLELSLG